MAELRVNPTRMELKRLRTRYATARRGHKLLKDKRDELMKRCLEVVRENRALREEVEARLSEVHAAFSVAAAVSSPSMLEEALLLPKKESDLHVELHNVMSVTVPGFRLVGAADDNTDACNYGLAFTSGELDTAVAALNALLPDLVRLAELEKTALMLAEEIESTRRRVNALEHIMMPRYLAAIKSISMKLDENERGNLTRLMKVKDMMLKARIESEEVYQ